MEKISVGESFTRWLLGCDVCEGTRAQGSEGARTRGCKGERAKGCEAQRQEGRRVQGH